MNALEWFGDVACVPEERHVFDQLFAAINHTKDHKQIPGDVVQPCRCECHHFELIGWLGEGGDAVQHVSCTTKYAIRTLQYMRASTDAQRIRKSASVASTQAANMRVNVACFTSHCARNRVYPNAFEICQNTNAHSPTSN
jgi:hypothetical protein